MRCLTCAWYCYDFFEQRKDDACGSFCGLHGGVTVDPSPRAKQMNLDNRGGCGYYPERVCEQLTLF